MNFYFFWLNYKSMITYTLFVLITTHILGLDEKWFGRRALAPFSNKKVMLTLGTRTEGFNLKKVQVS